mmetsp:Transcript_4977/g.11553  ORF Transcript_4977/g.11553 Transcript_4977/m.11553 type:complete len:407 (+) Transcript_4977:157-1377(+)
MFHRDNIGRGIHVLFRVDAVGTILVTRVISGSKFTRNGPGNFTLDTEQILAHFQPHVPHFSPVLTPAVANNPVLRLGLLVRAPTHDGHDVVGVFRVSRFGKDPTGVFDDGFRVNGGRHRTPRVNLGHDLVHRVLLVVGIVIDEAVLGYGGVGEVVQGHALAAHSPKGVAGLAGVFCGAGGIDLGAESLGGFGRAGQVRGAGVVGDVSGGLDELVGAGVVSPVARSRTLRPAVQNKLDAQVDVVPLGLAGDLDPVSQARQGSVGPATPAVLGNVLVQGLGQVANAVDVGPVEGLGEVARFDVRVREGMLVPDFAIPIASNIGAVVDGVVADHDLAKVGRRWLLLLLMLMLMLLLLSDEGKKDVEVRVFLHLHGWSVFLLLLLLLSDGGADEGKKDGEGRVVVQLHGC